MQGSEGAGIKIEGLKFVLQGQPDAQTATASLSRVRPGPSRISRHVTSWRREGIPDGTSNMVSCVSTCSQSPAGRELKVCDADCQCPGAEMQRTAASSATSVVSCLATAVAEVERPALSMAVVGWGGVRSLHPNSPFCFPIAQPHALAWDATY